MTEQIVKRRRGAALQDALLEAAWAELDAHGYSHFTIEGVAKRAETSRPVLYRRWPSRVGLATAAITHFLKMNPVSAPDMGNVSLELRHVLRRFADRAPPRLMRLIYDMSEDMTAVGESFMDEGFRQNPMREAVERGVARGEIDESKLSARILRLPTSLVVHEIVMLGRQITDEEIAEIVDHIFLPLIGAAKPANAHPL